MLQRPFSQRLGQRLNPGQTSAAPSAAEGRHASAPWVAGLLWLLAGLSAGYWGLRVSGQGPWVPLAGLPSSLLVAEVDGVARALGASNGADLTTAAAPAAQPRLHLLGVVAQARGAGAALIAVDGQPPKPQMVGATVLDGLVLQAVGHRSARLGASLGGPTTLTLELPATAARGSAPQ